MTPRPKPPAVRENTPGNNIRADQVLVGAAKIGMEVRNQYVNGYTPANPERDGKYRRIQVRLLPPRGLPPLRVFSRQDYYAPSQ